MRTRSRLILSAAGVSLLYLLLFPQPTRSELAIERLWAVAPETGPVSPGASGDRPFVMPRSFGYLSDDGQVAYRGRGSYGVAMASDYFVSYPRLPDQLVVQDGSGDFVASIPARAYPRIVSGRLLAVDTFDTSISEWTRDGRLLWSAPLPSAVTVVAADERFTAVGLSVGGLLVIDSDGSPVEVENAGATAAGGTSATVVAAAFGGGNRLAVVTGFTPPMVTVFEWRETRYAPVYRRELPSVPMEPAALYFAGSLLVCETGSGIEIGDPGSATAVAVPTDYPVSRIAARPDLGLLLVTTLGERGDPALAFRRRAELLLAASDGAAVARVPFSAGRSGLSVAAEDIYLVRDERVLKTRVVLR